MKNLLFIFMFFSLSANAQKKKPIVKKYTDTIVGNEVKIRLRYGPEWKVVPMTREDSLFAEKLGSNKKF